jgi:hypothetical protein
MIYYSDRKNIVVNSNNRLSYYSTSKTFTGKAQEKAFWRFLDTNYVKARRIQLGIEDAR